MSALKFRYSTVDQDIIFGPDAICTVGDALDRATPRKPLIVCGPTILKHADVVQRVERALGDRLVGTFSGVAPHSPVKVLQEAIAQARQLRPDSLISIGGGSTHDTCKGIATLLAEGGDIRDHEVRFEPPDTITIPDLSNPKIPIIAVPTTMGGSEFSRGAGFTDTALGRKILVSDRGAIPRTVIIDGRALVTTPVEVLTSTAMGQFRIAVETLYSRRHNPISDALALHSIKTLVGHLPRCLDRDLDCLLHVKSAACMASLAGVGGLGLNTAIAHQVGALFNVPHGQANAILLHPHDAL